MEIRCETDAGNQKAKSPTTDQSSISGTVSAPEERSFRHAVQKESLIEVPQLQRSPRRSGQHGQRRNSNQQAHVLGIARLEVNYPPEVDPA